GPWKVDICMRTGRFGRRRLRISRRGRWRPRWARPRAFPDYCRARAPTIWLRSSTPTSRRAEGALVADFDFELGRFRWARETGVAQAAQTGQQRLIAERVPALLRVPDSHDHPASR